MSDAVVWAELVYEEMPENGRSYGWWKRTVEGYLGRVLGTTEGVMLYDLVSRRTHG